MRHGIVRIEISRVRPSGRIPVYSSTLASGADVFADIYSPLIIMPGKRALIPTGCACAIPPGFELQVRPRSGLALRHGLGMVNAPGTIDADYRGEIHVLLLNTGDEPITIDPGDRIAQVVLCPVFHAQFAEVQELSPSDRGSAGFGSTGTR